MMRKESTPGNGMKAKAEKREQIWHVQGTEVTGIGKFLDSLLI